MEAFVGSWKKDPSTVRGAEALGEALGEFDTVSLDSSLKLSLDCNLQIIILLSKK